ncbi:hypothetical protein Tco_0836265 [Tanacetum coccineum]
MCILHLSIYQIIRANGADTIYMSFGAMLKDIIRDNLTEFYRLVMQKYGANRLEDVYDRVLWSDLRTMFEPPLSEDAIWKRKYPLSSDACQDMLDMKLQRGKQNEECYQLLKLIEKQINAADIGDDAEVSTSTVQETTHMVSSVKLPMLKKGEYTIWAIRMEEYLIHTDYEQWLVVLNGNSPVQYTKNEAGKDVEVPPTTAKDIQARARERKARSALLMALPDVDLPKYHLIKDAKGIWDAIKTRYGGNAASKKMQKSVLKQQFEAFSISNSEGLDKGFDRFQRLLTLLSIHGAELSTEDINSKFLRSLPSTWTNVSLIMRNKEGIDDMDIDDLYNTLKAHEGDVKGTTVSSSSSLNMAFVSEEITSSTDEISTAYHVNSATGQSNKAYC